MQFFVVGQAQKVYVIASLGGTPVTGLSDSDFTCYASKNGAAGSSVTLTGLLTELDSTNMEGVYVFALPSSVFDTAGPMVLSFSGSLFDQYNVLADLELKDDVLDVKALSGQVNFRISSPVYDGNGNMTSCVMRGYDSNSDATADTGHRLELTLVATYDSTGNMTSFLTTEQ